MVEIKFTAESVTELKKFMQEFLSGGSVAGAVAKTAVKKKEAEEPDPFDEGTDETEEVTLEIIRELASKHKDKKAKISALLSGFGAASISTLDEEHYGAFYLKLQKLK